MNLEKRFTTLLSEYTNDSDLITSLWKSIDKHYSETHRTYHNKTHQTNDNDTTLLIDFDLAILGKSSEVYKNYATLIRKEYKLVPNFLYKKERKKVLQHFIDKPFIYATDEFRKLYENKAKENLTNELNSL